MISIMAVLDVIGVASIMPFMGVVANPETIESNSYLNFAYNYFNFKNYDDFLYFLGLCVFLLLVLYFNLYLESFSPAIILDAILAKGTPFAFDTNGTVLLALGFTSITYISSFFIAN